MTATAVVVFGLIAFAIASDQRRRRQQRSPVDGRRVAPRRSFHVRPSILVLGGLWALVIAAPIPSGLSNGIRAAIVAALVVNVGFAIWSVRATTFEVVGQPELVFLGDEVGFTLDVHGTKAPVILTMVSTPNARAVVATDGDRVELPGRAHFRGVARQASVQIRSDGPLGFVGFSHTHDVVIRPIWIAPPRVEPREQPAAAPAAAVAVGPAAASDSGTPLSVREFVPGDSRQRVSWPVTARTGRLMAKTFEDPRAERGLLVLRLDDALSAAQAAVVCAYAHWLGASMLDRGWELSVLFVAEDGTPTMRSVDPAGLHRVVAEATLGLVPYPVERPALLVAHDHIEWL